MKKKLCFCTVVDYLCNYRKISTKCCFSVTSNIGIMWNCEKYINNSLPGNFDIVMMFYYLSLSIIVMHC